jgi:hypothetical protein
LAAFKPFVDENVPRKENPAPSLKVSSLASPVDLSRPHSPIYTFYASIFRIISSLNRLSTNLNKLPLRLPLRRAVGGSPSKIQALPHVEMSLRIYLLQNRRHPTDRNRLCSNLCPKSHKGCLSSRSPLHLFPTRSPSFGLHRLRLALK